MYKIFFDIETKNTFQDIGERKPELLDISVVGIYDSETNNYRTFLEEDFAQLWPILEKADSIIGYNSDHFDIPLLNKYYSGDLTKMKSVDLMKEISKTLGRRIKLDSVAKATLGTGKSGHGLEAITWWQNGEINKIKKYCLDDVRITKELYDYAMKHGYLKYPDGSETKQIKIDTSDWEKKEEGGFSPTLGF